MEALHHEKRGPQREGSQKRCGSVRVGVWQGLSWGPGICEESGGGGGGGGGLRAQRLRGENSGSVRRPGLYGRGQGCVKDRLREKCWLLKGRDGS